MLKVLDWIPSFEEVNTYATKMKCPLLADSSPARTNGIGYFDDLQNFVVPSKKRDFSLYILQCCQLGERFLYLLSSVYLI